MQRGEQDRMYVAYSDDKRPCLYADGRTSAELVACSFFFFQAEDGIRDADVTGVQTCALPISAVSLGQSRRLDRWSATTRLISSGMRRLKLRSPASMWATGTESFEAARAPASVEFVSP